eukprot:TRINITY_DN11242_c0_g1_i1.p1 TRINITY_DN11242_c0_g1~~TRINITY_DN11242_c0_g1_i1.p1  ORF type:complete len:105 (-),score=22.42 TRINITY_DN11242_c0_g1_i1:186-500(-)
MVLCSFYNFLIFYNVSLYFQPVKKCNCQSCCKRLDDEIQEFVAVKFTVFIKNNEKENGHDKDTDTSFCIDFDSGKELVEYLQFVSCFAKVYEVNGQVEGHQGND